jgi:hypothetical protein
MLAIAMGEEAAPQHAVVAASRCKATREYSVFKGVTFDKRASRSKKWKAQINYGGAKHNLSCFATEREAAKAFDAAARKHHGPSPAVNFPVHGSGEQQAVKKKWSPRKRGVPGKDGCR